MSVKFEVIIQKHYQVFIKEQAKKHYNIDPKEQAKGIEKIRDALLIDEINVGKRQMDLFLDKANLKGNIYA